MDQPQTAVKQRKATWRIGARERTRIQWVVVAIICILLFIGLRPYFLHTVEVRDFQTCQTNVRKIAQALQTYAADYDDTLPVSSTWTEAALGSMTATSGTGFKLTDVLHCPRDHSGGRSSYAFNSLLSGISPNAQAKTAEAENRRRSIIRLDRVPIVIEAHGSAINASYFLRGYVDVKGHMTLPHQLPGRTGSTITGALQASSFSDEQIAERLDLSFLKSNSNVKGP